MNWRVAESGTPGECAVHGEVEPRTNAVVVVVNRENRERRSCSRESECVLVDVTPLQSDALRMGNVGSASADNSLGCNG